MTTIQQEVALLLGEAEALVKHGAYSAAQLRFVAHRCDFWAMVDDQGGVGNPDELTPYLKSVHNACCDLMRHGRHTAVSAQLAHVRERILALCALRRLWQRDVLLLRELMSTGQLSMGEWEESARIGEQMALWAPILRICPPYRPQGDTTP